MTQLLTAEDVIGIRRQSAAIPHLVKAIIILAVFGALTGALSLYQATQLRSLTETNQGLAKDVRECTTPSMPKDPHECYDRARDDALRVRATRDAQAVAQQSAADQAATAANRAAEAATAAKAASEFLSSCFKTDGPCAKAGEENQRFIRAQLNTMLQTIQSFQFQVQGTIDSGTFTGTARPVVGPSASPQPCHDTIGVGNQAVLPGVLCTKP